jgi:hypothetical protein
MAIKKFTILMITMGIFAGCSSAPKSNEVGAAYVPSAQYSSMSCDQLLAEAESVRRSVPALEQAVDKHRSSQTGVEVVTWVLFWPAAFLLDKGEGTSSQLAKAKGELDAIGITMKSKKCGS